MMRWAAVGVRSVMRVCHFKNDAALLAIAPDWARWRTICTAQNVDACRTAPQAAPSQPASGLASPSAHRSPAASPPHDGSSETRPEGPGVVLDARPEAPLVLVAVADRLLLCDRIE